VDKTSICFSFDQDAPGLLYSVMGEFANRGINLARVESRPTKQSLGRYIFLVDLMGHREEKVVRDALEGVKIQVSLLKVFGSYPQSTDSLD
jgi:prephenate dehydratase